MPCAWRPGTPASWSSVSAWSPTRSSPMRGIARELTIGFALGYDPMEFADTLRRIAEGELDVAPLITGSVGVDGVAGRLRGPRRPRRPRQDPRRTLTHTLAGARVSRLASGQQCPVVASHVGTDLDVGEAGVAGQRDGVGPLAGADLDDERTLRGQPCAAPRPRSAPSPRARSAPTPMRRPAPSRPRRRQRIGRRDVGRVGHHEIDGAAERRAAARRYQSPSASRTRVAARAPRPARLARATASASADASVAQTLDVRPLGGERQGDRSRAGAQIDQPTRATERRSSAARAWSTTFGLGAGDQHPPVDHQVEACGTPSGRARTAGARRRAAGPACASKWADRDCRGARRRGGR